MISDILSATHGSGVISIIRGMDRRYLEKTLRALTDGGVTCIEITLNTDSALEMISAAKEYLGDGVRVGAGTVLDAPSAREAISAGADFVLAPTLDLSVIEMCGNYGKLAIPGCFTPTEALTAARAGAQLIKIFPAGAVGPGYIRDILAPLPQLNLLPVGGVNPDNAEAFIKAGAFALGVGSCLVNSKNTSEERFAEITACAAQLHRLAGR